MKNILIKNINKSHKILTHGSNYSIWIFIYYCEENFSKLHGQQVDFLHLHKLHQEYC